MTKLQLAGLFEGVGLVVDAWISKDAKGRSTTMGMVEFSEPAAAAKAVRAWHNKRPYSKGKRLKPFGSSKKIRPNPLESSSRVWTKHAPSLPNEHGSLNAM